MKDLDALREECLGCEKCGLAKTRTNVVFGAGMPNAKIMLIGEGPGENEDLQGEPFVGRGGQLLDKMLLAAGFSRHKNIYIANMVKCRPPQNRDPLPEETEACIGFLRSQTAILRPKIIVCLGRVSAMKIIRPDFKVTKEHGTWVQRGDTFLMGTFHPAALLRNPNNKPAGLEDFLALRQKAEELCPEVLD